MMVLRICVILSITVVLTACTSTFRISKDGKGYFLGSNSNAVYKLLCESGDLKKILSDARISTDVQEQIYKYNCSSERSGIKTKEMYARFSPEERKSLRLAFKKNGYDINAMTC